MKKLQIQKEDQNEDLGIYIEEVLTCGDRWGGFSGRHWSKELAPNGNIWKLNVADNRSYDYFLRETSNGTHVLHRTRKDHPKNKEVTL